ncbi:MAG TPA: copper resistance protein CopC [Actinomycetales bacterium]|nr:copper resistance protein CopC [Actinomycetales bacterium]
MSRSRAARRRAAGATFVLALLTALSLALAPAANAHDELVSSSPGSGDTVAPPGALTLTYSERLVDTGYRVVVRGPSGEVRGDVRVSGDQVVTRFAEPLAAGPYDVVWRVVSADGHPVSGKLSFRVRAVATPSASPRPASPSGSARTSATASPATTSPSSTSASSSAAAPTSAASSSPTTGARPTSGTGGRSGLVLGVVVAAVVAAAAALGLSRRNRGAGR